MGSSQACGAMPLLLPRCSQKLLRLGALERGAWGLIEWDSLCGDVMRCAKQGQSTGPRKVRHFWLHSVGQEYLEDPGEC